MRGRPFACRARSSAGVDPAAVLQRADALDRDRNQIAVAEEHRRLSEGADAARGPSGDDVARLEGEEARAERDQLRDAVDQVSGRRILPELAIDRAPDREA